MSGTPINIKIICVGKLKEKFYIDACAEYIKRLGAFCKTEITELPEEQRPKTPSQAETEASLRREGERIISEIPKGAYVAAMCVEGAQLDSTEFSALIDSGAELGGSRLCFIIGGSDGLHESVKALSKKRLSMSKMTFPHHLARVMLLEQIYRGFMIRSGSRYHK